MELTIFKPAHTENDLMGPVEVSRARRFSGMLNDERLVRLGYDFAICEVEDPTDDGYDPEVLAQLEAEQGAHRLIEPASMAACSRHCEGFDHVPSLAREAWNDD